MSEVEYFGCHQESRSGLGTGTDDAGGRHHNVSGTEFRRETFAMLSKPPLLCGTPNLNRFSPKPFTKQPNKSEQFVLAAHNALVPVAFPATMFLGTCFRSCSEACASYCIKQGFRRLMQLQLSSSSLQLNF